MPNNANNSNGNNMSNINANLTLNNKSCKRTTGKNFNKIAANSVKKTTFNDCKKQDPSKIVFKNEKEYQNSFDALLKFEKTFTLIKKKAINVIIFHDENNDGIVSAYYAWLFLVLENKLNVKFIPLKPSHGRNADPRLRQHDSSLKDSNVLLLDIAYSEASLDYIRKMAKSVIIIDDHSDVKGVSKNIVKDNMSMFVGDGHHAAVSYTFKFFFPKKSVPKIAQYIDNSDAKIFLPFTPFSNLFTSSLGFRYSHQKVRKDEKFFMDLHELLKDDNVNYWIFLGKYFEEVKENLKNQIAINARPIKFQGYNVAILNFNAPSLSKPVGRQMITNFKNMGRPVDFAVLWGYEYSTQPPAYRVQLIDDHSQMKISMKDLAIKFAKMGGHPKGGGGHMHVGNFYWGKNIEELIR